VLLRAAEPLRGLEQMAAARGVDDPRRLCSGPARLTQALGIDRSGDGIDVTLPGELFIAPGKPVDPTAIDVGPRVGIRVARDQPWRFVVRASPFASGPRVSGTRGRG
jgi:DNA-3-methyladenine glycosylase